MNLSHLSSITLPGSATVDRSYTTRSSRQVPRIYFTADSAFSLGGRRFKADLFGNIFQGGLLLDWNNKSAEMKACSLSMQQRVAITMSYEVPYARLLDIKVLGPVNFVPDTTLYHKDLVDFPDKERFPSDVRVQFEENCNTPQNATDFRNRPHGPWHSPTGLPGDLISYRSTFAPVRKSA